MLNKLKELIFGLNEFEKNKIEDRFLRANKIINDLQINSIENFEILEDIIYKIKEELRIKSSNLNKVIRNPKRNIKKNQVLNFLEKLNQIKYEFLNKAFSLINKNKFSKIETIEQIENEDREIKSQNNNNKIKEKDLQTIISTKNYDAKIENGKIPYILINFKTKIDFQIIKLLNNSLFDNYKAHGTNIIIENLKCLIIPRFNNDNLFNLPRIEIDLTTIQDKIKSNIDNSIKNNEGKTYNTKEENKQKLANKIIDGEFNEINIKKSENNNNDKSEKYIEINEKYKNTQSLKKKEDSLDELISNIENNEQKSHLKPNPKNDQSKPKIIIDKEKIEIEKHKKEIIEEKNPQIIIEKKENSNEDNKIKYENPKINKFEIYRDDKILAYINENSKVLGEIIIKPISNENIEKLNDNIFTYLNIFTKILSSILFEITQSAGTNILFNYKQNEIRIVPRFENDNLKNLKWENKENTSEFLDQVKNKLISKMAKEIKTDNEQNKSETQNLEKPKTKLEKKGEYILKSLSKIP